MNNIRISYDLLPAHSDEAIEALTLKVISHLRTFVPPRDWISRVYSGFDKDGVEVLTIQDLALFLVNTSVRTSVDLASDFYAFKEGESSDFLSIFLDVAGRLPDDLVLERLKSAGIRWVKFGGEIYISDRLTENELSNLILDRFGDSRCDQK